MHDVSWFRVVPFAREQGQIFILTPEKLDLDETVVRSMVITFAFVHSLFAYNWPGQEKTGGRLKKNPRKQFLFDRRKRFSRVSIAQFRDASNNDCSVVIVV